MMTSAATVASSITRKSGRRGKLTLRTLDRPGVLRLPLIPIHPQFPKWYACRYGSARTGRSRQGRNFKVKWAFPSWRVASGAYSTGKDGATMKVKVLSELAVVETIVATKS
jgi:hypothetical protein